MAEEKKQPEPEKEKGPVAAWEPFGELREWRPFGAGLPARLERLLAGLEEDWPWASRRREWIPALDVHETEAEYAVTVELPGARAEDVTVEFQDGVLTIRGEKKSEREEKKEHSRYVERRYGSFSRSFTLPSNADPDQIHASFRDGVLTVSIAKREQEKPRTISVKA